MTTEKTSWSTFGTKGIWLNLNCYGITLSNNVNIKELLVQSNFTLQISQELSGVTKIWMLGCFYRRCIHVFYAIGLKMSFSVIIIYKTLMKHKTRERTHGYVCVSSVNLKSVLEPISKKVLPFPVTPSWLQTSNCTSKF